MTDKIEHPKHYTSHPSGIECIDVAEHMSFCRGNAIKYLWRAGQKDDELEDLLKAAWYIEREISRVLDEAVMDKLKAEDALLAVAAYHARFGGGL